MGNLSVLSIEDLGNLLQGRTTGFHVEEVDEDEFESDPESVDHVQLPIRVEAVKSKRVDVLVDGQGNLDPEVHDHETLGTNLEWQNLDGVCDEKTGPCKGIADAEDPDESDDSLSGGLAAVGFVASRADRPEDKDNKHAGSGCKEEWAATHAVCKHSAGDTDDEGENDETAVDAKLSVRICDTDTLVDVGGIVGCETISTPLGEKTQAGNEEETVAVALCLEEVQIAASLAVFEFKGKRITDFLVFKLDSRVVNVSIGVVFAENSKGLVVAVLRDQPTW